MTREQMSDFLSHKELGGVVHLEGELHESMGGS